jgi:hypothetical protein
LATPGQVAAGVETSLDTARTSACATIIFEVRSYRTNSARLGSSLEEIFPSAGIHPLLREKLTFLIPFENLSAREQAWNILNADSRWHEVRREVQSYQFGLYRLAA